MQEKERVHMQEKERERVNTAGHEHYSGEYTKWRFSFDVNRYKYGGRSRFLSRQEMNWNCDLHEFLGLKLTIMLIYVESKAFPVS